MKKLWEATYVIGETSKWANAHPEWANARYGWEKAIVLETVVGSEEEVDLKKESNITDI